MKRLILVVGLLVVMTVSEARNPVSILAINSSIIYFKINKDLMGATLEIEDEAGNALIAEKITHKKVIIDFFYMKAGKYRVKIKYSDLEEVFIYENVDFESARSITKTDEIIVSQ